MYEFGVDVGGMDRSRYFGVPIDLYHYDHFMGAHFGHGRPCLLSLLAWAHQSGGAF